MSGNDETREFFDFVENVMARYGHTIRLPNDKTQSVVHDLGEILQDMNRLHPILKDIANLELSDDEFRKGLSVLEAWSWHTSDHLTSLKDTLFEEE